MSSDNPPAQPPVATIPRRHDLDALRAVAMLLGIALHAALSFVTFPWVVQDARQNEAFGLFFHAIHGFRMPLFFLISGFFTAMLWRRRGLKALLWHRFRRVFLPCMLGLFTIVPAIWVVTFLAMGFGLNRSPGAADADLWTAAASGDAAAVGRLLEDGAEIDELNSDGTTPLTLAALSGHSESVALLIQKGADVNARNRDGGTPLHAAAFLGHAESVELLIAAGADVNARNSNGDTPLDNTSVDWGATQLIASLLQIELDREQVESGRASAAEMLRRHGATDDAGSIEQKVGGGSDRGDGEWGLAFLLIYMPVFHHLWFLWFLCWLVAGFAVYAWIADRLDWKGPARWLVVSPARLLWLIPLTMIPQAFMGLLYPTFGPDTSTGILPAPQILFYYAVFFGFGALYFDCEDNDGSLGRAWWWTLPLGLLILYPVGLEFTLGTFGFRDQIVDPHLHRPIAIALQVIYTWTMTFALMGLFHSLLSREHRALRYLSDSSYWLYVAHLPLILVAQAVVRNWQIPASLKFGLVCIVVSGILLLTYQTMVRYTWLGTLLNGPRQRPVKPELQHSLRDVPCVDPVAD